MSFVIPARADKNIGIKPETGMEGSDGKWIHSPFQVD
jgi:hypothetical protein